MIYKVDFEGQACKQIKEKAESYQYDSGKTDSKSGYNRKYTDRTIFVWKNRSFARSA